MKSLTLLIKPAAGLCNMNCGYCFYRAASETRENRVMTEDTADMLIRRIREYRPSALSVMFQGGEPTLAGLDFFRTFVKKVKERFPEKTIWCYTGYLFEDILNRMLPAWGCTKDILNCLDVLVDSPFVEEEKELGLRFRGSKNQRIIDVKKSLTEGKIKLWEV